MPLGQEITPPSFDPALLGAGGALLALAFGIILSLLAAGRRARREDRASHTDERAGWKDQVQSLRGELQAVRLNAAADASTFQERIAAESRMSRERYERLEQRATQTERRERWCLQRLTLVMAALENPAEDPDRRRLGRLDLPPEVWSDEPPDGFDT